MQNGTETVSALVEWKATDERSRGAWANDIDTTEAGAYACALAAADDAELAARQGAPERAIALYRLAAQAEAQALAELDVTKTRTLGIIAVSAVALWYKARDHSQAERIAHQWLGTDFLPPFAVEQLQGLLQTIWSGRVRERVGVKFTGGEVLVSVKGGEIVTDGAPLDLIMRKVRE